MFATHYHELTDLAETCDGVKNYNVGIREWGEKLVFLRRFQEGSTDKSYGIQVARLAGLPDEVVRRSKNILRELEDSSRDPAQYGDLKSGEAGQQNSGADEERQAQMGLFQTRDMTFMDKIIAMDMDGITPLDALNLLTELKKRYG